MLRGKAEHSHVNTTRKTGSCDGRYFQFLKSSVSQIRNVKNIISLKQFNISSKFCAQLAQGLPRSVGSFLLHIAIMF